MLLSSSSVRLWISVFILPLSLSLSLSLSFRSSHLSLTFISTGMSKHVSPYLSIHNWGVHEQDANRQILKIIPKSIPGSQSVCFIQHQQKADAAFFLKVWQVVWEVFEEGGAWVALYSRSKNRYFFFNFKLYLILFRDGSNNFRRIRGRNPLDSSHTSFSFLNEYVTRPLSQKTEV
jgi:hypothetical protein